MSSIPEFEVVKLAVLCVFNAHFLQQNAHNAGFGGGNTPDAVSMGRVGGGEVRAANVAVGLHTERAI